MKRIIITILGGIFISLVIGLIFPSALLTEEAQQTYQSERGRIDIGYEGGIRNGKAEVKGDNLKISRPKWFLGENYQGVMVEFPVSYIKKFYQITIIPEYEEGTEGFELLLKLRGQDYRINNQRKAAYVQFKNVKVNEGEVVGKRVVWHDRPYQYRIGNAEKGKEIEVSFYVKKPFALTDIVWERAVVLFLVVSILIFTCLLTGSGIKRKREKNKKKGKG